MFVHFSALHDAAKASGEPHLAEITKIGDEGFQFMRAVVLSLATSKRTEVNDVVASIQAPLGDIYKKIGKLINKDRNLKNHTKAIEDGLKVLQFFL